MPRVEYTGPSRADYKNAYKFISKDSRQNAEQVLQRFEEALERLSQNPDIGRQHDRIAPSLYSWSVDKYVLFYRPIEDGILLLRILHGALLANDRVVERNLP